MSYIVQYLHKDFFKAHIVQGGDPGHHRCTSILQWLLPVSSVSWQPFFFLFSACSSCFTRLFTVYYRRLFLLFLLCSVHGLHNACSFMYYVIIYIYIYIPVVVVPVEPYLGSFSTFTCMYREPIFVQWVREVSSWMSSWMFMKPFPLTKGTPLNFRISVQACTATYYFADRHNKKTFALTNKHGVNIN